MFECKLILPMRNRAGHPTDEFRKSFLTRIAATFGGCTTRDAQGKWIDANGRLVSEPVIEIMFAADDTPTNAERVNTFAFEIGRALDQDAVYVRYGDGSVAIIPRADYGKSVSPQAAAAA